MARTRRCVTSHTHNIFRQPVTLGDVANAKFWARGDDSDVAIIAIIQTRHSTKTAACLVIQGGPILVLQRAPDGRAWFTAATIS